MRRRRLTPPRPVLNAVSPPVVPGAAGLAAATVLVGGISELFQGDLDFGRHVIEALQREDLAAHILVEELHYGAIAVMQRLQDVRPAALILVGAATRDRAPGTLQRRSVHAPAASPAEIQLAVSDAVTGYVAIDLVVEIAAAFDVLPAHTLAVEIEPAYVGSREQLSPQAAALIVPALTLIRREAARVPLLQLAAEIRAAVGDQRLGPAPALDVVHALLGELSSLARDGQWGASFALRDRLRDAIGAGQTPDYLTSEDWALWWALIEELDRLRSVEASDPLD